MESHSFDKKKMYNWQEMHDEITHTDGSRLTSHWLVLSEGHHYEITALHLTLITHQHKKH